MGYIKRFYDATIHVNDRYVISLPFLHKFEGHLCEAIFFYSVANGYVESLGNLISRDLVTGKTAERKIVDVLTPEEYDRVLSVPVDFRVHANAVEIRQEYLALYETVILSGRQLEDFERQLMASMLTRVIPAGGLMELYRALTNEYYI